MIVGNIRIIANRNRQLENQFGILKLQADLNQYYKQAQKKALGKFFEPIKPVKPKEQMTLEDIQGELKRKLSKFMLDDMFNMVDKFIRDYLVGASRLRASQMNELVNVFIIRKLREEQPVVVGSGIGRPLECRGGALPVVKSKYLSGGQRRALVESLKLAGNDALR
jgi:hypothetical protein